MPDHSSVTQLIVQLKEGDELAAQEIWERYFNRLQGLARKKLGNLPKRTADEEDVALSAMNALCQGAREGRFRSLENRDDIWQILVMIASRKAANAWRRQKSRHELGESAIHAQDDDEGGMVIQRLVEGKPNDEMLTSLGETCEELFEGLDEKLKTVVYLKLEGYTNEEISQKMDRSVKTVERYLKMIRSNWSKKAQLDHGE